RRTLRQHPRRRVPLRLGRPLGTLYRLRTALPPGVTTAHRDRIDPQRRTPTMTTASTDVHNPHVQQLAAGKDWPGLVRSWMAHQHEAALDAAIGLVGGRPPLASFLSAVRAAPFDARRRLPEALAGATEAPEQLTLRLVLLYPRLVLCEFAKQFPLDQQEQL